MVITIIQLVWCLYAVAGVSAEWVDEHFTSLRVTLPEGGVYRISYSAVSERKNLEPRMVTTSRSLVVKDFSPDYCNIILVDVGNDKGKQNVMIVHLAYIIWSDLLINAPVINILLWENIMCASFTKINNRHCNAINNSTSRQLLYKLINGMECPIENCSAIQNFEINTLSIFHEH